MSKNQELADFIWPVADLLRGDHVRPHKRHVPSNLEGSTFKDAFHRAYFGVTSDDFEYEPLMIHSPTCEVIGNIYEHPDLLKYPIRYNLPVDPEAMSPELILACARRDVSAIFHILNKSGIPQRRIAELVGMNQSEVSEIFKGRKVMSYDVLVRIAEGLGIPRGIMGLAYDEGLEEVDEEMKRRALFGVASVALFNSPVLGELLQLPKPATPTPLPSRLGASDVTALKNLTEGFRGIARAYGGCADMVTPVAQRSLALAPIPGANIKPALADLQTMAGWCCVDSEHYDNSGLTSLSRWSWAMTLNGPQPFVTPASRWLTQEPITTA